MSANARSGFTVAVTVITTVALDPPNIYTISTIQHPSTPTYKVCNCPNELAPSLIGIRMDVSFQSAMTVLLVDIQLLVLVGLLLAYTNIGTNYVFCKTLYINVVH